jgi:hypothetical protein
MWVAAWCSEANIRTAPTAKLIATAMAKVWLDRMGSSPVLGGAGFGRLSWGAYSLIVAVQRNSDISSNVT